MKGHPTYRELAYPHHTATEIALQQQWAEWHTRNFPDWPVPELHHLGESDQACILTEAINPPACFAYRIDANSAGDFDSFLDEWVNPYNDYEAELITEYESEEEDLGTFFVFSYIEPKDKPKQRKFEEKRSLRSNVPI